MPDGEGTDFPYHRSLAPMLWMFVLLAGTELFVVHFLVSFWSVPVALILSVLSLATIVWMIGLIRSLKRLPVRIADGKLVFRAGTLRCVETPLINIAGVRLHWSAEDLKAPGVLNLALIAYPNVIVDLVEPVPGRRPVRAIAHRLDDGAAFVKALSAAMAPQRS